MNNQPSSETTEQEKEQQLLDRRMFLRSVGKWSGAAIAAVGFGGAWLANTPRANAGLWINRWGAPPRRRGRWVNRWGRPIHPGRWINTWGPPRRGGWINWW